MSTGPERFHFDHSKSIGRVNVDDIDSIRHAFATFDKDGSGTIDAEELYLCLKAMGHHPGPLELEELLAQMDTNGDGVISFEEFAAVMAVSKGEEELEEELAQLKSLYVTIDQNGDGMLSCDELHKAFRIMGIDLEIEEIAYIFSQIDDDGSGEISFEEFASYVWHFGEGKEEDHQNSSQHNDEEKERKGLTEEESLVVAVDKLDLGKN